jgi:hypothetical protein
VASGFASAFSDAGTEYSNDKVRSKVILGDAGRPMETVDMILCMLNKSMPPTLVNSEYLSVLNFNLCNDSTNEAPLMGSLTIDTSRASNTSSQITKMLFEIQVGTPLIVRADSEVKKEPTLSSPYGELEFNYSYTNLLDDDLNHGSLVITDIDNVVSIELTEELDCRAGSNICFPGIDHEETPYNDMNYRSYIDASVASDGNSGMAKVGYVDRSDSSKKLTYLLNWNNDFIAQYDLDTNDVLLQSSCRSRGDFLESATGYGLYDEDGSRVNATTFVYGYYGTEDRQPIFISKRNAWFSGGETGSDRPTTMFKHDGTALSISYDPDDSSTQNYDTDNDGTFATITGIELSDSVSFPTGVIIGSSIVYNDETAQGTPYEYSYLFSDGKYFSGIPQVIKSGNSVQKLNIKNGTLIEDDEGVNYILKQSLVLKYPEDVDAANCAALTAAAVNAETKISSKTSADITAIDSSWVTPDVGDNPKVIDGVIQ